MLIHKLKGTRYVYFSMREKVIKDPIGGFSMCINNYE